MCGCQQQQRPTRRQLMMIESYLTELASDREALRSQMAADSLDTYAIDADIRTIDSLICAIDTCLWL